MATRPTIMNEVREGVRIGSLRRETEGLILRNGIRSLTISWGAGEGQVLAGIHWRSNRVSWQWLRATFPPCLVILSSKAPAGSRSSWARMDSFDSEILWYWNCCKVKHDLKEKVIGRSPDCFLAETIIWTLSPKRTTRSSSWCEMLG